MRISLPSPLRRGAKSYDLVAALPLIAWYLVCLDVTIAPMVRDFHVTQDTGIEIRPLLSLLSQVGRFAFAFILIVLLVVRRTPIAAMPGLAPRILAVLGTYLGIALLVLPGSGADSRWLLLSSFLVFFGTTFGVYSLVWLGRSISIMPESRKLVTSGPYAMIRHPLYLGEQIALLGVALQSRSDWALAALALQLACQLCRMNYEEKVLQRSFPEYQGYMAATYRLIPWLY
jgi:protein-S-isoprenylcysteine O-methyltransferase Ste14